MTFYGTFSPGAGCVWLCHGKWLDHDEGVVDNLGWRASGPNPSAATESAGPHLATAIGGGRLIATDFNFFCGMAEVETKG